MGMNLCPSPCKMHRASAIHPFLITIIWIRWLLVALLGNFPTSWADGGCLGNHPHI